MAARKTALRLWLLVVAGARVFGIYLALAHPDTYKTEVYANAPDQVTALFGRLFVTWTSMSLVCCLLCAWDPWSPAIRLATMYNFASALGHFAVETALGVAPLDKTVRPLLFAGPSLLWLITDWLLDAWAAPAGKSKTKRS